MGTDPTVRLRREISGQSGSLVGQGSVITVCTDACAFRGRKYPIVRSPSDSVAQARKLGMPTIRHHKVKGSTNIVSSGMVRLHEDMEPYRCGPRVSEWCWGNEFRGIGHGSMVGCAWESSVKVHWSGGVVTGLLGAYLPGSGARIVACSVFAGVDLRVESVTIALALPLSECKVPFYRSTQIKKSPSTPIRASVRTLAPAPQPTQAGTHLKFSEHERQPSDDNDCVYDIIQWVIVDHGKDIMVSCNTEMPRQRPLIEIVCVFLSFYDNDL
ncbi:hypothetical protein Tco_0134155 [Tanacetum coccineum]